MSDEPSECLDTNPVEGQYANYFKVGHNAFEFVLDFGQLYSEGEEPRMHTRIVTSPAYVKAFLRTLNDSVEQFERDFGVIPNATE